MRPHGRARVSPRNPQAWAICDRCSFTFNHVNLAWQFEFAGAGLYNTKMLVCSHCMDTPQEQLKAIVIPADPIPISNPRTQNYVEAESDLRRTSGQDTVNQRTNIPVPGDDVRITQADNIRVTQQTGEPPGGLNEQPGIDPTVPDAAGGNDPGLPLEFVEIPETGPLE